jgi:hypothetical protein
VPQVERKPPVVTADADHLHLVYESVLRGLSLSSERLGRLRARGLNDKAIEANGYRDTPNREQAVRIAQRLSPLGLGGVPGFYFSGLDWRMVACLPGHFVPYRDIAGRISGLSYRLDVPLVDEKGKVTAKYLWLSSNPEVTLDDGRQKFPQGTKLTPPLHFSGAGRLSSVRDILLTEGALKADVAAHLLGASIIGAGGVTQWGGGFAQRFKREFPGKRAVICYDSDWRSNPHVRHALESLMANLRDADVRFVVRSWPEYPKAKGIDDLALVLSQSKGEGVRAA